MYFTQFYAILCYNNKYKKQRKGASKLGQGKKQMKTKKKLREAFRDGFSEGRKRAKENSYRARKNRNTGSSTKRGRT